MELIWAPCRRTPALDASQAGHGVIYAPHKSRVEQTKQPWRSVTRMLESSSFEIGSHIRNSLDPKYTMFNDTCSAPQLFLFQSLKSLFNSLSGVVWGWTWSSTPRRIRIEAAARRRSGRKISYAPRSWIPISFTYRSVFLLAIENGSPESSWKSWRCVKQRKKERFFNIRKGTIRPFWLLVSSSLVTVGSLIIGFLSHLPSKEITPSFFAEPII